MKINKLRLKGMIGIKKGLGLDEIELDFSGLSGLIALSGPNGSGKTTILDCLQPYRQMASRKRSLQHHCFLPNSEKELEFEFNGDQYKTLLKIDAESDRSEGYIWKNGESLVNGKVKNYDKLIIEMFGSSTLFFNSVFCGQGSIKLNEMRTGDLKKLFSEFLRLDRLIEYENTAKQSNNLLTSQSEKLEREIKSLKELVDIYGEATAKLQDAKTDKQRHEQSFAELSNDIKQAEAKLSDAQTLIQKNELIRTKVKGLQDNHNRIEKEIKTDQEQSKVELENLRANYRKIDLEIVELESLLANELEIRKAADAWAELTVFIGKGNDLLKIVSDKYFVASNNVSKKEAKESAYRLKTEKVIEAAGNNRDRLKLKTQHAISQELSDKETERAELAEMHGKLIAAAENNGDLIETQLKSAKFSIADLEKRDRILAESNEPECTSKACPFITTALSAQADIPKLEAELAEETEAVAEMKKTYSDVLTPINVEIEALRQREADKNVS